MARQETLFDLAYRGKTSEVKTALTEDEALKTKTDSNGRMLIHWAALGGHDDLVRHLISLGSPVDPPDDTNMTPLILAASAGRERVVNTLLTEGANVNAKTVYGCSALQYAASKNWKSICVALLEKDANINQTDQRGATPLHRAASKGNTAIVKLLIEYDKDSSIAPRDADRNTPLHLACEDGCDEAAKLLVENGADITFVNKEDKTPLELASHALAQSLLSMVRDLDSKEIVQHRLAMSRQRHTPDSAASISNRPLFRR